MTIPGKGGMTLRDYIKFGVLWVVLSALGEWAAYAAGSHFYFTTGSQQAVDGQNASLFVLLTVVPVFIFVVLMLLFGMSQFRRKRNDDGAAPSQFRTNKAFIGIWVGISIVVNLFLFVHPTASAMEDYFKQAASYNADKNELIVEVTGRQWEWQFSYPQYGITQSVDSNGSDLLVLPVNRPVKFVIRSYEFFHPYDSQVAVIHSFWIPAFGMKTDAVPGETRYEYVLPTQISSTEQNPMFRVQCAEVCGPGHPFMYANMKVVSASDFTKWVTDEKKLQ